MKLIDMAALGVARGNWVGSVGCSRKVLVNNCINDFGRNFFES